MDEQQDAREELAQGPDGAAFRLTSCYAADRCQQDLCCPFRGACLSALVRACGGDLRG